MTREEAIDLLDNLIGMVEDNHNSNYDTALQMAIKALEQEPKSEWQHDHEILKAYSDGANEMLDKVRAEIGSLPKIYPFVNHIYTYIKTSDCMQIIDNYRSESEGKA